MQPRGPTLDLRFLAAALAMLIQRGSALRSIGKFTNALFIQQRYLVIQSRLLFFYFCYSAQNRILTIQYYSGIALAP